MDQPTKNPLYNFTLPKTSTPNRDAKYLKSLEMERLRRAAHNAAMKDYLKKSCPPGTVKDLLYSQKSSVNCEGVLTTQRLTEAIKTDYIFKKKYTMTEQVYDNLPTTSAGNRSSFSEAYSFLMPAPVSPPAVEVMSSSDDDDDDDAGVAREPPEKVSSKELLTIVPDKELTKPDPFVNLDALLVRFRERISLKCEEPSMDAMLCIAAATEQYLKTIISGAFLRGDSRRVAFKALQEKAAAEKLKSARYDERNSAGLHKDAEGLFKNAEKIEYLKHRTNLTALRASAPRRKYHDYEEELKVQGRNAFLITKKDIIVFLKNAKEREFKK